LTLPAHKRRPVVFENFYRDYRRLPERASRNSLRSNRAASRHCTRSSNGPSSRLLT
jgi:hypothetical protein